MTAAERQLCEEGARALRHPNGKLLLILHISRLPAPKAHHVRVARLLLQETALRYHGQVFVMRNNDLVLLCREAEPAQSCAPHAPEGLPHTFDRLFGADAPDDGRLTSLWALESEPEALQRYLAGRADAGSDLAAASFARSQPVGLAALQEVLAKAPLAGLLVQQTGLALSSDRHLSFAARLTPMFQAVSVDLARLNVAPLLAEALGDPLLFRHFAERLDVQLLRFLEEDLVSEGPLFRSATLHGLPIMLDLGLRAIVSPAFATVSRSAAAAGVRLWAAVSLLQAGAELDLFEHARGVLRLTGCCLVLNRLDIAQIGLIRPACLQADLIVLNWVPGLPLAMDDWDGLKDWSGARARVVLAEVNSETALAWGQSVGIGLFQGMLLDQIQAATRMQRCHSATACSVRQCTTRAASLAMPGRAGCANPALLSGDSGAAS